MQRRQALSAERRCAGDRTENGRGRRDRAGYAGLFLHHVGPDEDADRPLLAGYLEIRDKEFYFIVAAAETSVAAMERTIDGFRGFLDCLDNPQEKGVVYGVGAWHKGDIQGKPAMKQAYEMGRNI